MKYYLVKSYRDKIKVEAKRRMDICEKCEHLQPLGTCGLCGCVMKVKTKGEFELDENGISIDGCEDKRW